MNLGYIIIIIASFFASIALTSKSIQLLSSYNVIDYPNDRSSHRIPIPRAGGIALVIVFMLAMWANLQILDISYPKSIITVCLAGFSVAIIGLYDDIKHANFIIKLILYALVVGISLYMLGIPSIQVGNIIFEASIGIYLLGFIVLLWVLNLFNFMDGIDGIASLEAISIALGGGLILAFYAPEHQMILPLFCIASVTAGFLVWNYPPARIFMGDVASGFLGFTLALLGMITCIDESMNVWAWFILFGVFFVDATVTLLRRIYSRNAMYVAHCDHAYQRATLLLQGQIYDETKRSQAHRKVSLIVLAINWLWLIPFAFVATANPQWSIWATLIALTPLVIFAIYLGAGSGKDIKYRHTNN